MNLVALMLALQIAAAAPSAEVCSSCEYTSIRSALDRVESGGTIRVKPGLYREAGLTISKPVRLLGEPGAIIDGDRQEDAVRIVRANNVEISGFEVRSSGKSYVKEYAGIKVEDSESCVITGNTLHDNNYGIYLANTKNCEIRENKLSGVIGSEADTGNGIHIWQGSGHQIEGNSIEGQRDGIYFEFVSDSVISRNRSCANLRYGLHFMFSNTNKYLGNEFCSNGAGVAVMYSHHIEMVGNNFHNNQGTAAYGLLLKEIRDSRIEHNSFDSNSVGVFMEGTNRGIFKRNAFQRSGWGLRIMGDCEDNRFESNNFVANMFDVSTNSSNNPNSFARNYWSQYDGYDLNRDGHGDTPFRLVSLSSLVVERVDGSFSLMRSPLLMLLDSVERALPELTPERMQDEDPLMSPVNLEEAND